MSPSESTNSVVRNTLARIKSRYYKGGLLGVGGKLVEVISREFMNALKNLYFRITPSGTFYFNGNKLKYFRHTYNLAYENERKIEIPIVHWFLRNYAKGARLLEVGNVLGNYGFRQSRDILDKYDSLPGLINEDVIDFSPKEKYEVIVSISTLEHVGWDEAERDPGKILAAIKNLMDNCVLPGGIILATLPLGYNAYFDEYLKNDGSLFSEQYFFKRVSSENEWEQIEYSKVASCKFGEPFNNANALFIGILRR